jgi:hypothetical protein
LLSVIARALFPKQSSRQNGDCFGGSAPPRNDMELLVFVYFDIVFIES